MYFTRKCLLLPSIAAAAAAAAAALGCLQLYREAVLLVAWLWFLTQSSSSLVRDSFNMFFTRP